MSDEWVQGGAVSGIAKIEDATLTPTKMELVAGWLGSQSWFTGDADAAERVGSFRFVDPGGEVGIETLLIRSRDVTYQVPLTYRNGPLEQAGDCLIGTMEHSVLGTRWVYDAVGDSVYIDEVLRVIHELDTEADLSRGEKSVTVRGTGMETTLGTSPTVVQLLRALDSTHAAEIPPVAALFGSWTEDGEPRSAVLATLAVEESGQLEAST
jgi:hypothetical protein